MKKYLTLSLVLALTFLTAACNDENKPVIDSSNVAIPVDAQKRFSADKIGNLIAESAAHRGWQVQKAGTGLIKAEVHNRKTGELEAAAIIRYNKSSYGITEDKSKAASDPRYYARYSANLRREIDKKLATEAYK